MHKIIKKILQIKTVILVFLVLHIPIYVFELKLFFIFYFLNQLPNRCLQVLCQNRLIFAFIHDSFYLDYSPRLS